MQRRSKETLQITKKLGLLIKKLRQEQNYSCRNFASSFDIDPSNLNRTENGLIDCKITSFYKIAQALGLKPSQLMKILEDELGDGFSLVDE